MNRKVIIILVVIIAGAIVLHFNFKYVASNVIANAILKDEPPAYLPERVVAKIRKVRAPINDAAEELFVTMRENNVDLDQVLSAIDNVKEEQALAFLDEVIAMNSRDANSIFDLAKQRFPVDFDVEVFREPFLGKATPELLKKVVNYADHYRDNDLIDFESAKRIAKRILTEKEKEFRLKHPD